MIKNKKQCPSCKLVKSIEQFDKSKHNKDNLAYICKACLQRRRFKINNDDRKKFYDIYGKLPSDKELKQFLDNKEGDFILSR